MPPTVRHLEAEVLEIEGDTVLVEVYGGTQGIEIQRTTVSFSDAIKKVPLSADIVGRVFNGSFQPKDGALMFIPEKWKPITGAPINPAARARPEDFIETGFSPIDGLNTLVRGQKLPVFSAAGLPSKEVVASILKNSRLARNSSGHSNKDGDGDLTKDQGRRGISGRGIYCCIRSPRPYFLRIFFLYESS